jgi:hypothetical protein
MLYVIPHRNGRDNIRKFRPYPGCGGKQSLNIQKKSNAKRLQRLIDTKLDDVRRPAWILVLGRYEKIIVGANNDKVRSRCLEAADAGAGGEAFYAVAQLYEEDEDWENQKKYLHIAADLSDHRALYRLACLSLFGQSNTKQDDAKHSNG